MFYQNITKRKVYRLWTEVMSIRQNQLKLGIRFELYLEQKTMMNAFGVWQKEYQQIQINEYVDEYYINKILQTFMIRWKIGAEIESKANELKIASFREKYNLIRDVEQKKHSLTVWIKLYEKNMDLQSKVCQYKIKKDIERIKYGFDIWRDLTLQRKHYLDVCNKCSIKLNHFQILYFLSKWRYSIIRKNELHENEKLIAKNHRKNQIESILTKWRNKVIANNDKYDMLKQCFIQIRHTQTIKYFERWKVSLIHSYQYRELVSIHKQRCIKCYFVKWLRFNQYVVQQKHIEQQLKNMQHRSVLIQSITIWKSEFVRIQNRKSAIKILNNMQKQYALSHFVDKWRDFSQFEQLKKRANEMYKLLIYRKVLKQWDNFSNIVLTEKQHNAYIYQMQLRHLIFNHFNQWQHEFNLIANQKELTEKFERRRILKIFLNWKGHSRDMINLKNKGKRYSDDRCDKIKRQHFDIWYNLYKKEQVKWTHIQQWIVNKKQMQCLKHLNAWKRSASQSKLHQQQVILCICIILLMIYDFM